MKTDVSIIIPAYNEQRCILRAIKSVQGCNINIEVIVVDDCSTDCTVSKIKSLNLNNEIKLVSHRRNMGLSQARLSGLANASGEYVFFGDADDTVSAHTIDYLYRQADRTHCDIVQTGIRRINRAGIRLPFFNPLSFFKKEIYTASEIMPILLGKRGFPLSVWGKLYRRDMLAEIKLEAEKIFMGEDMLLNMRVFNSDAKLSWVDHIGYNWTTGGGSSKTPQELWNDDKKLYLRCVEVLTEINADTEINRNALASGAVEAFVSAIAGLLANPFRSRNKTKAWVARELSLPFWQDVKPCLGDAHKGIDLSDAEAVFAYAGKYLKSHWLYYAATPLLR